MHARLVSIAVLTLWLTARAQTGADAILREAFPFAPATSVLPAKPVPAERSEETVLLEPLVVTGRLETRTVNRQLDARFHAARAEAFDWQTGGLVYQHAGRRVTTKVDLRFDPDIGTWKILSFSW
jgi:hypothetical protein